MGRSWAKEVAVPSTRSVVFLVARKRVEVGSLLKPVRSKAPVEQGKEDTDNSDPVTRSTVRKIVIPTKSRF